MTEKMNSIKRYEQKYLDFCKEHGAYKEQSTMTNNVTSKVLSFEDGSTWYEVSSLVMLTQEEAHAKKLFVGSEDCVSVYKTEYWTSDNGKSRYRYEIRDLTIREKTENLIPKGLGECLIFVNETKEVLSISVGSGDNLLKEDINEGYVDYLDVYGSQYAGFSNTDVGFEAGDGDMYMTKVPIEDVRSVIYDFLVYRYDKCPNIVLLDIAS